MEEVRTDREDADLLLSYLEGWKFKSAVQRLCGQPKDVRELVEALAATVGEAEPGEGFLKTVVEAALDNLVGRGPRFGNVLTTDSPTEEQKSAIVDHLRGCMKRRVRRLSVKEHRPVFFYHDGVHAGKITNLTISVQYEKSDDTTRKNTTTEDQP